jgi:hypothetical protein
MNDVEAAQHLQTIRTLMERAALYRRALGPILTLVGALGTVGAGLGWFLAVQTSAGFITLWLLAATLAMLSSFLLVRRQALRAAEPFWTPPTRRVVAAMVPPLFAGAAATLTLGFMPIEDRSLALALPPTWLACYGLAVHAAGFFTLRGMRQLGWAFLLAGTAVGLAAVVVPALVPTLRQAHLAMGLTFGLGHLIAGGRLLVEERNFSA